METVYQRWVNETMAQTAIKNLRKNYFEALYVNDAKSAFEEIRGRISTDACIGLGDSLTLQEIGVIEELETGGYDFLNPWKKGITRAESLSLRRRALTSDIFLTGANAVTMDGKLVCIDGLGNRVAGMIFGPLKVIVAAGVNKIVENAEAAIARIKKIAAPVNARKHDFESSVRPPCSDTGFCSDCSMPRRICCNTAIIEGCRDKERICVMIIGKSLGY